MDSSPSAETEPPPHSSTKMEEPSHRTESEAGGDDQQPLRRPMNAFLLFCKRHRRVVKSQHPWLDNRSCTKMLADMWAVLDAEEKSKYLQLAREVSYSCSEQLSRSASAKHFLVLSELLRVSRTHMFCLNFTKLSFCQFLIIAHLFGMFTRIVMWKNWNKSSTVQPGWSFVNVGGATIPR